MNYSINSVLYQKFNVIERKISIISEVSKITLNSIRAAESRIFSNRYRLSLKSKRELFWTLVLGLRMNHIHFAFTINWFTS